jgi:mRNA interferase MazF
MPNSWASSSVGASIIVSASNWSVSFGKFLKLRPVVPSSRNGLTKKSVADCLQTRPIDHRARLVKVRGELEDTVMTKIDDALKIVFALV